MSEAAGIAGVAGVAGVPMRVFRHLPITERLLLRLEWRGSCLEWTGRVDKSGYGVISETVDGRRYHHVVHRYVFATTVGEIPDGMYVLHSCDNRRCCNPDHLRIGTHEDNMRDRAERGRTFNGRRAFTHCPRQHAYDEANTYISPTGTRSCRTCHRERARAARERKSA